MGLGEFLNAQKSEEVLEILTRECRDLLNNLAEKDGLVFGHGRDNHLDEPLSEEERNQIIRDHFAMDNSGYGIAVEEWLPGLDGEARERIVNRVLASPEYQDEPTS